VRLSVAGAVEHSSNLHGGVQDTTRQWTPPTCRTSWLHWPYRKALQQTLRWSQVPPSPLVQEQDQQDALQMPARAPGLVQVAQVALQSMM
jgi:hypothetical protein